MLLSHVARNDRVLEFHYLARRAARRFARTGICCGDLEQAGAIGLIKAAERYDPAFQTPFEAYAWRLVIGEVQHYVRAHERPKRLGIGAIALRDDLPLRAPDPDPLEYAALQIALDGLGERDRYVIAQLGAGLTQREVAHRLGCSQKHVSRIFKRAAAKLAQLWLPRR